MCCADHSAIVTPTPTPRRKLNADDAIRNSTVGDDDRNSTTGTFAVVIAVDRRRYPDETSQQKPERNLVSPTVCADHP